MSLNKSPRNSVPKDSSPVRSKSPTTRQLSPKEWERRSAMIGTSVDNLKRAVNTYGNEVGPGQYESPAIIGQRNIESKTRNHPAMSVGVPRLPNVVNPETRNIIGSKH